MEAPDRRRAAEREAREARKERVDTERDSLNAGGRLERARARAEDAAEALAEAERAVTDARG